MIPSQTFPHAFSMVCHIEVSHFNYAFSYFWLILWNIFFYNFVSEFPEHVLATSRLQIWSSWLENDNERKFIYSDWLHNKDFSCHFAASEWDNLHNSSHNQKADLLQSKRKCKFRFCSESRSPAGFGVNTVRSALGHCNTQLKRTHQVDLI